MLPTLPSAIYRCSIRGQEILWLVLNNRFDLLFDFALSSLKRMHSKRRHAANGRRGLCAFLLLILASGCSIRQSAVNMIGDALAEGGGVFASDNDPELIQEALPFGLKLFESLLASSPDHRGLLLAAARGFTAYAFLIQDRADRLDAGELREAQRLRIRARDLYLRGRDYALRGIETRSPQFIASLRLQTGAALQRCGIDDAPYLYWAGAAWAGALSTSKNDPGLLIELPVAGALVARVLELDEHYEAGAAHEFFIAFEAGRPGGSLNNARRHYRRAVELSRGQRASAHLALAESVSVKDQNLGEFRGLLNAALATETSAAPQWRLQNTIALRRAAWLQSRIPELFLEAEPKENPS